MKDDLSKNKIQQCDLIVTENCSLQCKMCHIWKHKRDDQMVSFKEYADFIVSLKEFSGDKLQMQFVGGEPLLKEGVLELIKYASVQGFSTTMTTNGALIDKKMADGIINSGLNTIGFSLESLKERKHDFLRGVPSVYKKIMETLSYFSEHSSLQLFISSIITGYNLDDIVELAEWVNKDTRINFIYFQAVMQPFAMPENDFWYKDEKCRFLWPNIDKVTDVLDKLAELKKKGYKINNQAGQFEAFKAYFSNPHKFIKNTKCNLGYNSFTVLPDGNIFLCLSMQPIGNIKTDKIDGIWFSEKAAMVREQIANCKNNCKLMINCFFEEERDRDERRKSFKRSEAV